MKAQFFIYMSIIMMLVLSSCATDYKRWPSGGIEDRIAPIITFHTPQAGSLNQDKDITAEIEFSEFIDYGSTRNAITISPYSVQKKSKIIWYEKSVKIEFSDLKDDQTVLIALNTSLKDLRNNTIKNNFILNFSTGEKIDKKEFSGNINGVIVDKYIEKLNYSKLKVNLYKMDEFTPYVINDINPEYSVGVSDDMTYKFTNISADNYIPVIFYDKNNNSKLEMENEYLSLSSFVNLKDNDEQKIDFTLAKIDTIPPFIEEVTQIEKNILKMDMSEDISILKENIISSIIQNDSILKFEEFYDPAVKAKIYIRSKDLDVTKEITINLNEITDRYGNLINEKMKTKTVFIADTVKKEKLKVSSNLKNIVYKDQKLEFNFNWIQPDSLLFELISSIDSSITILNDIVVARPFISEIDLPQKQIIEGKYSVVVKYGNNKIFSKNFSVENELGYGSVAGKVENAGTGANLIFQNCDNKINSNVKYGVTSDYKIQLRPGKYICAAYLDANKNELLSINLNHLNIEKAVFRKDTILIRKNWESAEINFDF
ncbi:MAG: Ig-like domain-containing protein [Candidatus Delongbacteria bacterium]|jgi:uncharacterized protein (DUF2141 family)|nr:Ig-like domain-containing protein [Candidatus Delongbacteria bacterium]